MDSIWYLKKHDDDAVHGPVTIASLRDWALAAKVSPLDRVSNNDQKTWRRAPMIPELHMDWLIQVSDEFLYGPTTFGTVQEFIAAGEITGENIVINCKEGHQARIKDMPVFNNGPRRSPTDDLVRRTARDSGGNGTDNEKVRRLERVVLELRLALGDAEMRYQKLRNRFIDETGQEP
jgi:hypothetical protein